MIPTLLWRCPLCRTNDALVHKTRWFRADTVHCSSCGVVWQVKRVMGDDYYLKVTSGDLSQVGLELPLAEWYDRMKASFELESIGGHSLTLGPDEFLYLHTEEAVLVAQQDNPLFFHWDEQEAPIAPQPGQEPVPYWQTVGEGEFYLTNERLVWQGGGRRCDFWWKRVNSAFTDGISRIISFGILYGLTTYRFRLPEDSVLKWITYTAHIAKRIEEVYDHRMGLSPY